MKFVMKFGTVFIAMVVLVSLATASTIQTLQFTGTGGISVDGIYTAPYWGTLGGVEELFICVDDQHQISTGDTWEAYIGSQADLSHAYYQGSGAAQLYGETFAIGDQILTEWNIFQTGTPAEQANAATWIQFLQVVDWDILNPGSMPLTLDQQVYLTSLQGQDLTGGFSNWHIASDVAGLRQEFEFKTPEPAYAALVGLVLVSLGLIRRRLGRHNFRE